MRRVRGPHRRRLEALQEELRREDEIVRRDSPARAPANDDRGVRDGPPGFPRRGLVVALLGTLAGIVLLVAGEGVATTAVGLAMAAVGGVALALLAFYAVGQSEDRDRARRR
jgi:hypothetical protein